MISQRQNDLDEKSSLENLNPQDTIHNLIQFFTDKSSFHQVQCPLDHFLEFISKLFSNKTNSGLMKFLIQYKDSADCDIVMRLLIQCHYYKFKITPQLAKIIQGWEEINPQAHTIPDKNGCYLGDYIFSFSSELFEITQKERILKLGHPISNIMFNNLHSTIKISEIKDTIEKDARENNLSSQNRFELREEKAKPILEKFKIWLDSHLTKTPVQSKIDGAIRYSLSNWEYLNNYLLDGRIEIDNNLIENAIRPFALGRKNWLFSGSPKGAKGYL